MMAARIADNPASAAALLDTVGPAILKVAGEYIKLAKLGHGYEPLSSPGPEGEEGAAMKGLVGEQKTFLIVLLRLVGVFLPLYWVYVQIHLALLSLPTTLPLKWVGEFFEIWNHLTAFLSAEVAGLLGIPIVSGGNEITVPVEGLSQRIIVGWECNFFLPYFSYIAMVMAFPGIVPRDRLIGILEGLFLINVGNVLRIATLGITGYWFGRKMMNFYHAWMFNYGMTLWIIFIFLLWLYAGGRRRALEGLFTPSGEGEEGRPED
jgi:exosortase/archaeosortase family protein